MQKSLKMIEEYLSSLFFSLILPIALTNNPKINQSFWPWKSQIITEAMLVRFLH